MRESVIVLFVTFFLSELSEGKEVLVKMANLEEKKDEHREQFEYWLSIHAKSNRSSVISTIRANQKLMEMSQDE